MLQALLILMLAGVGWAQAAGSADCADCHREIAESYARTGMGRSFYAVNGSTVLAEFSGGGFLHAASGEQFTPVRRDGKYFVRRSVGAESAVEVQVDYVMGSGNHARSYLHRTADDRLVEIPVSWYPEDGGHWAMSPGYDRPRHAGFSREAGYRCMFCHNAYPGEGVREADGEGGTVYPKALPQGIDCGRCHGSGEAHVEAVRSGKGLEAVRAGIVNPGRLEPVRRMEVCLQCHLESTTRQLPATLLRFGRGIFSYRPGEPLEDYVLHFDFAAGSGEQERFDLVSAGYRLLKSACYRESGGRITCVGCHDPHSAPSAAEAVEKANRVCEECHQGAKASGHPAGPDCVSCHMPKRRADDAVHMWVTDHGLEARVRGAGPAGSEEVNDSTAAPYAGEVALFYPRSLAATPENAVALAAAQVKELSNLPDGLGRLETALKEYRPAEAEPYFQMGLALLNTNQAVRSVSYFQEAVRRDERNWRYQEGFARALVANGRGALAASVAEQARRLAPGEGRVLATLGLARTMQGRLAEAAEVFREAVGVNPESSAARNNLGSLLLRGGDVEGAEEAFGEAVRLQPEDASVRLNLVDALLERGKLSEARYQLEQAIRSGASVAAARAEWTEALAAGAGVGGAKAAYEGSLRSQPAEAHNTMGSVLTAEEDYAGAVREYRLAVAAAPDSAAYLANLGVALARAGERVEARASLEEAVRRAPELWEAQLELGSLLVGDGLKEEAKEHLERAAGSPDGRIREMAVRLLGRI